MRPVYIFALITASFGLGVFIGWGTRPKLEDLDMAVIGVMPPNEDVSLETDESAEEPEYDEPQYPSGDYYERPWMPMR